MIDDHSNATQTPPRRSPRQSAILSLLESIDIAKYSLSRWYLGALYAIENPHNPDRFSQAAQSIRELLEKLPRVLENADVQVNSQNFKQLRVNLHERFQVDKSAYENSWAGKEINSHLGETLTKIDDYLDANQQPTRREEAQKAVESTDPLSNRLDANIRRRKRDKFHELRVTFENIAHHQHSPDEKEFDQHMEEFEDVVLGILSPETTHDQLEIRSILHRQHWTSDDVERLFLLVERTGANYSLFFNEVSSPSWLDELNRRDYFSNPPHGEELSDGRVNFPYWVPIDYLVRIADRDAKGVVDTVLKMGNIDNPKILNGIAQVALNTTSVEQSLRLNKYIIAYMDSPYPINRFDQLSAIPKLIEKWFGKSTKATKAALKLAAKVVAFVPDPEMDEKRSRHARNPDDLTVMLNPAPRFAPESYQKILEGDIVPLVKENPWQLASMLIRAATNMCFFHHYSASIDQEACWDGSEGWCPRLGKSIWRHASPEQALINALTYACECLYNSAPEHIEELNERLAKQPWLLFNRIRQHLYAHNPNAQTKPWIREMVLSHPDYAEWDYHYEFQQMLRCACERFGEDILTKKERVEIFDAIISGPSKDAYRNRFGDKFTEDAFRQLRRKFHHKQLRPFSAVLFGEYSAYFKELEAELSESVSDEDYSPVPEVVSGMTYRSPKSPEHLANLPDEELLVYINEWQGQHDIELDWTRKVSIDALSGAFRKVFMETIALDESRLNFWLENRDRIQRPIYVRVMVDAMQENVKGKKFAHLERWLDFCQWVISHPDSGSDKTFPFGEKSRENPNWTTSRRSVADFIKTCLAEEGDAPVSARSGLANLLHGLCTQPDWTLDEEEPDHDSLVDIAINRTRGIALENAVYFGIWARRHDSNSAAPEIATVLNARFNRRDSMPVTLPEYAVLGFHYFRIAFFAPAWARERKADIFPHDNFPAWRASFSAVIRYVHINEQVYRHLKDEYRFAVERLWELPPEQHEYGAGIENLETLMPTHQEREERRTEIINRLGHHLFVYYLWGMFSTDDSENLLTMFYEKTRNTPKYWRNLFDYAGRLLKLEGETWGDDMTDKAVKFFEWRFAEQHSEELQEFFHWWLWAECLPAEWRLDHFLQILNLCQPATMLFMRGIPALSEMLEEQPTKVVECFAKMTDFLPDDYIYIDAKAKEILRFGINSDDQNTRQYAEHAREKLLGHGYFDFLQLDD